MIRDVSNMRCPGCRGSATRHRDGKVRCDQTGIEMSPVTATQMARSRA